MIAITNLFEGKLTRHLKKHWGKYTLLGGGLAAAALGKEVEDSGVRKVAKSIMKGGDDSGVKAIKVGKTMQKYGNISTGAGAALGLRKQIEDEAKLDSVKKDKKK